LGRKKKASPVGATPLLGVLEKKELGYTALHAKRGDGHYPARGEKGVIKQKRKRRAQFKLHRRSKGITKHRAL